LGSNHGIYKHIENIARSSYCEAASVKARNIPLQILRIIFASSAVKIPLKGSVHPVKNTLSTYALSSLIPIGYFSLRLNSYENHKTIGYILHSIYNSAFIWSGLSLATTR